MFGIMESSASFAVLALAVFSYLYAANSLRFSRMREMHKQFPYPTRDSLAKMTTEDAQKIQDYLYKYEFPFVTTKALEFALFKTYGIPTISKLLVQTEQLSSGGAVSRRVDDTKVLFTEFIAQPPTSKRSIEAIARMNYIHSLYQKAGRISNDDMLYTLSLFALEPLRWAERYEWRAFTEMEQCAAGVFWKGIGDAMKITFENLPSSSTGWTDGLHWLTELENWSKEYEERCMVPHIYNKKTADHTKQILLWRVPQFLQGLGAQAVSSMMDDRLRKAMMYARPSRGVEMTVHAIIKIRKYLMRYIALPRPDFLPVVLISDPDSSGRMHKLEWDAEPWYIEGTFWNRWSLVAWVDWFSGRPLPGDKSSNFKPEGFTIPEVGPANLSGKGLSECKREAELVASRFGRGCPMAFGKAGR